MRVLVTGSNGLVGRRVSKLLESLGHTVLGLSRGAPSASGPKLFDAVDLTLAEQVDRSFDTFVPEAVIHTASMTEVDACEREPHRAWTANVVAASNVAVASRRHDAHLVHVSTDYVFDGDHGPYSEDDLPNPRGVYAITKHAGEEAVRVLAGSWTVARTAVVYGWPMADRPNFGAWMVGALSKGQQLKLFEDQVVTPTLVDNLAEMLAELATRRLPGTFHTAGSEAVDRVSFGLKLCEVFGFDPGLIVPTRMAALNLPSPRPLRSALVTEKIQSILQAKPLGVDAQLRRFHTAFRNDVSKSAAA